MKLAHPDACPLCGAIHGEMSTGRFCPVHGHRLGWIYGAEVRTFGCPVRGCGYQIRPEAVK